jgi:hypothetical protein
VRTLIGNGIDCLEPRINVHVVAEAVGLMRDNMLPLFAEEVGSNRCAFEKSKAQSRV